MKRLEKRSQEEKASNCLFWWQSHFTAAGRMGKTWFTSTPSLTWQPMQFILQNSDFIKKDKWVLPEAHWYYWSFRDQKKKFSKNSKTFQKRVMMPGRWSAHAGPFKDSWAHISPSGVLLRWLPVTLRAQQALLLQLWKQSNYGVFWNCKETTFMRRYILFYIQLKKFSFLSSDECICCRKVRKGLVPSLFACHVACWGQALYKLISQGKQFISE